jgi:hypothetical protein
MGYDCSKKRTKLGLVIKGVTMVLSLLNDDPNIEISNQNYKKILETSIDGEVNGPNSNVNSSDFKNK